MSRFLYFFSLLLLCTHPAWVVAQQYSALWGQHGEAWQPGSRLPDFSYAGYHYGEDPLPKVATVLNIKDFGAIGDGLHDDTEAMLKALDQLENGALLLPEGTYRITQVIRITKPNVVIRGEGMDKTTLFFPQYLNDLEPNWGSTTEGRPTSNYAWSGGFIRVEGEYEREKLDDITQPAQRGEHTLTVATDNLSAGQWIEIQMQDDSTHSMLNHLYADDPASVVRWGRVHHTNFTARIENIRGKTITLNRPLRFDLRPEWQPAIYTYQPTVTEVGIEGLTMEFPVEPYQGHFTELGFNGITLGDVAHCWIKNIRFKNADSGIFLNGQFCTIDGVLYESDRDKEPQRQSTGHHGIYISDNDNVFNRFVFKTKFIHDISVSHCAGNVISDGAGVDICFDHHKRAPYANLFTNIHLGEGSRMWQSGGGGELGRHTAAWATFWNIRANRPLAWKDGFGPDLVNLVGLTTNLPSETQTEGLWFEAISPNQLYPQNLHQAQLNQRLNQPMKGSFRTDE